MPSARSASIVPPNRDGATVRVGSRSVELTNLRKVFWPETGRTKGDLLRYYAAVADVLVPHLRGRAMVMKRYPNGAGKPFFFMKRVPVPHPSWLNLCSIEHGSGNVIDFPIVDDLAALLWTVNLGCIDLNQWYARCDDVDRPDYVHFDLDPVKGATFEQVRETATRVHEALDGLKMPNFAKTTGSRGIHVYVPIVRGPTQKQVWTFAKALAQALASQHPDLMTSEYRIAKRPRRRVLVDYNQNAWGRTLASVYSVRPTPAGTVSAPVTWAEVERGVEIEDFDMDNMPKRIARVGDLFAPLLAAKGRYDLRKLL